MHNFRFGDFALRNLTDQEYCIVNKYLPGGKSSYSTPKHPGKSLSFKMWDQLFPTSFELGTYFAGYNPTWSKEYIAFGPKYNDRRRICFDFGFKRTSKDSISYFSGLPYSWSATHTLADAIASNFKKYGSEFGKWQNTRDFSALALVGFSSLVRIVSKTFEQPNLRFPGSITLLDAKESSNSPWHLRAISALKEYDANKQEYQYLPVQRGTPFTTSKNLKYPYPKGYSDPKQLFDSVGQCSLLSVIFYNRPFEICHIFPGKMVLDPLSKPVFEPIPVVEKNLKQLLEEVRSPLSEIRSPDLSCKETLEENWNNGSSTVPFNNAATEAQQITAGTSQSIEQLQKRIDQLEKQNAHLVAFIKSIFPQYKPI